MKTNGKGKQALSFHEAGTEIAQALAIPHQAAGMLLYGLAATGNVRTLDDELDPIDEDKCTSGLISALRVTRDPAKGDPGGEAPRPRPPPPSFTGVILALRVTGTSHSPLSAGLESIAF
jgi:hypothetical protein